MNRSNPELYKRSMAYAEEGSEGLDAFAEAQKTHVSALQTSVLASTAASKSNATNKDDYPNRENTEDFSFATPTEEYFKDVASTPMKMVIFFSEGIGYNLFWFPFLIIILSIILFELTCYVLVRQFVALWEYLLVWRGDLSLLQDGLRKATTYEEWKRAAQALDTHMSKDAWRKQPKMPYYESTLINNLFHKAKSYRQQDRTSKLVGLLLHSALKSNVGNIDCSRLYSHTYYGTKRVIEKFLKEVNESLDYIGTSDLTLAEKKKFFKEAFRSYGRTALCLSGGASLAYFHFGVIRALLDDGTLPSIITGTSAGSMIAAMVACRTDDELRELLIPDMYVMIVACKNPLSLLKDLFANGTILDSRVFARQLQWVTKGHTTFLEAYRQTGKILNITAVPYNSYAPAKLFNYLSTPNVVIWSAVQASCSLPGVLAPVTIMTKEPDGTLEPYLGAGVKWRDGSFQTDIPVEALKSQFNVTYTIVSQTNPHVAVFYFEHRGSVGNPPALRSGKGWRGGFLASSLEHFIKLDLKKWLRVLRDLELLPFIMKQDFSNLWLQKFDGNVTILPFLKARDYLHIFADPDLQRMEGYFRNGSTRTWPKLHMINNRMDVENSIMKWLNLLYTTNRHLQVPLPISRLNSDSSATADSRSQNKSHAFQNFLTVSPALSCIESIEPSLSSAGAESYYDSLWDSAEDNYLTD